MGIITGLLKAYWPQLAAFFIAVSIGFGIAWNIQGIRLDSLDVAFNRYQAEVEMNAATAKRAALDKEKFWLGEIENARINAQSREARLKRDVANAQSAVVGLRNDLSALRARLATSTEDACINTAAALGGLLAQCSEDYRAMAEVADRHLEDTRTLIDAWPR